MTRAIESAVELLRDEELVWDSDFDDLKGDIVALLLVSAAQGDLMQTLADNLAKKICYLETKDEKNSVYDPNLETR
jgi:hypothetical protein